jgi:hypothetical protein
MRIGAVLKVMIPPTDDVEAKGEVEPGALAVVVDGSQQFPDLYKELLRRVKEDANEFVWVEWVRTDDRWKGRVDGAYAKWRFNSLRIVNTHLN